MEHWDTVMVGRTHGVHAEPTTFGHTRLLGVSGLYLRATSITAQPRREPVPCTVSAPCTYRLITPEVERHVCDALGLGVEPVPSQVVARDRHAQLMQAVAALGACIEQIALELRLLQRTEVREVEEHRTGAYQGSSAMPHKRNPTTSERLCGLARLLRGYADTALENVALWHERDLATSVKVIPPDSLSWRHFRQ
nr:lyase family protein [Streptomyces sp. DHE17-7]